MSLVDDPHFQSPPAEYRPVAMWFLNGRIDDDEARRQVRAMAEGGVGGIQVAARTGLGVPYLSERWFNLVALIAQEAQSCGVHVWLADEYPYPSGAGGGEVILRHPEYRAWHMRGTRLAVQTGEEITVVAPGTVLLHAAAVPVIAGRARWDDAIPLDGYVGLIQREQALFQPSRVYLTTRRYMTNDPRPTLQWRAPASSDAPAGTERWDVWLIAAAEIERYKFFGAYVDLCNPDAVRFFLDTTYQRYFDRLDPERFAQLAGFFVDESHPQNWSWRLPDFFRQRCGYDLLPALPALWTDVGPRTPQVRYDYMQSITELFVQSFHRPLAAWCHDHGVQVSLEVGSTRNSVQRYADVPGIDPGHDKVGTPLDQILARELSSFRGNLNFPASLAAQTGKRRVLDELFHSVGWSLTLQDMKAMLDRAAARGANLFAFHGFCYTIGGLKKWDAPPSEFDQNPYWPHFPQLAAYAGRLAYALSRGRRVAPVALVDPITSLWAHGEAMGAGKDALGQRLVADWASLMRELIAAQRPHDNVDPLLLAEARVEDGRLLLGEAEYRAVVLPPITTLERAAWDKLEEFVRAGGTVVACGLLPFEQIEPESDVVACCADAFGADPDALRQRYEQGGDGSGGGSLPVAAREATPGRGGFVLLPIQGSAAQADIAAQLLRVLDEIIPPDLALYRENEQGALRNVLLTQRRAGDDDLFLLANSSMDELDCQVQFRAAPGEFLSVTRLDLETGAVEPLALASTDAGRAATVPRGAVGSPADDQSRFLLHFPPCGAHLLAVSRRRDGGASNVVPAPAWVAETPVVTVDLDGEWRCVADGDNVLRLDRFQFHATPTMAGDDGATAVQGALSALAGVHAPVVEPKPLIDVLQDLGTAGLSWPVAVEAVPRFGASPALRLRLPTVLWYGTTFEAHVIPSAVHLCVEREALHGNWALWLNGAPVDRSAFVPRRRWSVDTIEADVTPLLRAGTNQILLRVDATEEWDGLVDALYLLGGFGVTLGSDGTPHLTAPPERARWDALFGGAMAQGGYPYYAGTLRLTRPLDVPQGLDVAREELILRLPDAPLMFAGVAQVAVNGHALPVRPWAPYVWRVPAGTLRPSANEFTLAVTTTLIGQLEGKRYDPHLRQPVPLVVAPASE